MALARPCSADELLVSAFFDIDEALLALDEVGAAFALSDFDDTIGTVLEERSEAGIACLLDFRSD